MNVLNCPPRIDECLCNYVQVVVLLFQYTLEFETFSYFLRCYMNTVLDSEERVSKKRKGLGWNVDTFTIHYIREYQNDFNFPAMFWWRKLAANIICEASGENDPYASGQCRPRSVCVSTKNLRVTQSAILKKGPID